MSKPTKRNTKTSQRDRRSHHAIKGIRLVKDEDGNLHLPHHMSPTSGKYRGKNIKNTTKRVARRARKVKAQS